MKKVLICSAVGMALVSTTVFAGVAPPPTTTYGATLSNKSKTETKGYVGLNWTLGGGMTPALVIGAANAKVRSDGDTHGANLAFHLNVFGGVKPAMLKLSYLNGKSDVQGEIGVGYSFLKSTPLLGIGVNAPYAAAGVDAFLGGGFDPYFMLQSRGKFDEPNKRATCNAGDTLVAPTTCETVAPPGPPPADPT